jgi:hypothetical protein
MLTEVQDTASMCVSGLLCSYLFSNHMCKLLGIFTVSRLIFLNFTSKLYFNSPHVVYLQYLFL